MATTPAPPQLLEASEFYTSPAPRGGCVDFVIEQDKSKAKAWAEQAPLPRCFGPKIIFCCDGSANKDKVHGGIGVAYKRVDGLDAGWITRDWICESLGVQDDNAHLESSEAEVFALYCALSMAWYEVTHWSQLGANASKSPPDIIIMTDSRHAINYFKARYLGLALPDNDVDTNWFAELLRPLLSLQSLHCRIIIRWLPGHDNIEGNERADSLARLGKTLSEEAPRRIGLKNGTCLFSLSSLLFSEVFKPLVTLDKVAGPELAIPATKANRHTQVVMKTLFLAATPKLRTFLKDEIEKTIDGRLLPIDGDSPTDIDSKAPVQVDAMWNTDASKSEQHHSGAISQKKKESKKERKDRMRKKQEHLGGVTKKKQESKKETKERLRQKQEHLVGMY
ncbi:hypothetical protein GGR57DRAFT_520352 [Xylariaceae sp. FL1272]|nr:hypothetical protein GGR57DRAFT_520352 [Xylariaceae sp. FL1272]